MDNEPNLRFDIDALFSHLTNNLDYDFDEEQDWHFALRSSDINALQQVAEELEDEFTIHLQDTVEQVDIHGNVSLGPAMLSVIYRGVLGADEVKQIAERITEIADERGLGYEGVNCYEPIDEEELFGWLAPEDAGWRLRHMTDCGLADDADLPFAFLILSPTRDSVRQIALELQSKGIDDSDQYDSPDEEGHFGMCVFVQGRNNEFELNEHTSVISTTAELHGGHLAGVQFYSREEVAEVFGLADGN